MKKLCLALIAGTMLQSVPAFADEAAPLFDLGNKDRWIMRLRAIDVSPDESSSVTGLPAGTEAKADFGLAPELDFTYMFTKNVGAELILATTRHEMSTNTGIDLGNVKVLPPHINLQYHFNPEGQVRPYAGAGLGYIMYYDENPGTVTDIKYDDGVSYSLQAGLDYGLNEHWAINADVKKLYHNTDVSINGGAITADVDLDPWVFGVGVAYRF